MRRERLVILRKCILDLWENDELVLNECIESHPGPSDAKSVEKWVHGLAFSRANIQHLADSPEMEVEMPFLFVLDDFIEPFIGIYLLNITDTLIDGFGIDFSMIHFTGFIISDRFLPAFSRLPLPKKWVTFLILNAFIPSLCDANVSVFPDSTIKQLKSSISDIIQYELS